MHGVIDAMAVELPARVHATKAHPSEWPLGASNPRMRRTPTPAKSPTQQQGCRTARTSEPVGL